ncbi:MAG: PA14 domain-containing protein [Candidatus Nanohalobium sp.]
MKSKTVAVTVFSFLLFTGFAAGVPSISLEDPGESVNIENPGVFEYRPDCPSGCDSAGLQFNSTGNLSFEWSKSDWSIGEGVDVDRSDKLSLDSGGVRGSLNYTWYDTTQYYSNNGHPGSKDAFDEFFNPSNNGVSLGGEGLHSGSVHWNNEDGKWGAKPGYLPAESFSWKASGVLYAPETGTYSIGLDSDDASDVFINDSRVVSWYGGHGVDNGYGHSSQVYLEKGFHNLTVRMEEGGGQDGVSLAWQRPGESSFTVIPEKFFGTGNFRYEANGSFEFVKSVETSSYWTGSSIDSSTPTGTNVDIDFGNKVAGGWNFYDTISDLPKTDYIKVNISLNSSKDFETPEVSSLTLNYKSPASQQYSWKTDSSADWKTGEEGFTTVEDGKLKIKKNKTGSFGTMNYRWFETVDLNGGNSYADSRTDMDKFVDGSRPDVKLMGSGVHSSSIHWGDDSWENPVPTYITRNDHFSWLGKGLIYVSQDGDYTFSVDSDDASDLIIDGNLVASWYGGHGDDNSYGSHTGTVNLDKGFHDFRVRMQENKGGNDVNLGWRPPGATSFTTVPAENFTTKSYWSRVNYTSKVFKARNKVSWESADLESPESLETDAKLFFGYNTSGTWQYTDSIDAVPDTQYLKYKVELSTSDSQKTPVVDSVEINYSNTEASMKTMEKNYSVQNGDINSFKYDFSSYNLPATFKWRVKVNASDGSSNVSDTRKVTVEPETVPLPNVNWDKPRDKASNESPVNFTFKPECFSEKGCYNAKLYFNSTGEKKSWVDSGTLDWKEGDKVNVSDEGGDLVLNSSAGSQGLRYRWYETEDFPDDYANDKEEMDLFTNRKVDGVQFEGKGLYSDEVRWSSGSWGSVPSYISPQDTFSWTVSGLLYAPEGGTYGFRIDSDDGSDLLIDGEAIVSRYGPHGTGTFHSNTVELEKGYHRFTARMQEDGGGEGITVGWKKPSDTAYSTIPSSRYYLRDFQKSGSYTSPVKSFNNKVKLLKASISKKTPIGTDLKVEFLSNSSGSWKSYDSVDKVPESRYLKYKASFTRTKQRTPKLEKINITYQDPRIFNARKTINDVINNTEEKFQYSFNDFKLPKTFEMVLGVEQSNGIEGRADPRTVTVEYSGITAQVSWNDASGNEIGFKIYSNSSGSWRKTGQVPRNTESFSDKNRAIDDGEYVCYRVKAFNGAGASKPVEGCSVFHEE